MPQRGAGMTAHGARPEAVKISLYSANQQGASERAEVTMAVKDDSAFDRMIQTLAARFPPESVMTIAPAAGPEARSPDRHHHGGRRARAPSVDLAVSTSSGGLSGTYSTDLSSFDGRGGSGSVSSADSYSPRGGPRGAPRSASSRPSGLRRGKHGDAPVVVDRDANPADSGRPREHSPSGGARRHSPPAADADRDGTTPNDLKRHNHHRHPDDRGDARRPHGSGDRDSRRGGYPDDAVRRRPDGARHGTAEDDAEPRRSPYDGRRGGPRPEDRRHGADGKRSPSARAGPEDNDPDARRRPYPADAARRRPDEVVRRQPEGVRRTQPDDDAASRRQPADRRYPAAGRYPVDGRHPADERYPADNRSPADAGSKGYPDNEKAGRPYPDGSDKHYPGATGPKVGSNGSRGPDGTRGPRYAPDGTMDPRYAPDDTMDQRYAPEGSRGHHGPDGRYPGEPAGKRHPGVSGAPGYPDEAGQRYAGQRYPENKRYHGDAAEPSRYPRADDEMSGRRYPEDWKQHRYADEASGKDEGRFGGKHSPSREGYFASPDDNGKRYYADGRYAPVGDGYRKGGYGDDQPGVGVRSGYGYEPPRSQDGSRAAPGKYDPGKYASPAEAALSRPRRRLSEDRGRGGPRSASQDPGAASRGSRAGGRVEPLLRETQHPRPEDLQACGMSSSDRNTINPNEDGPSRRGPYRRRSDGEDARSGGYGQDASPAAGVGPARYYAPTGAPVAGDYPAVGQPTSQLKGGLMSGSAALAGPPPEHQQSEVTGYQPTSYMGGPSLGGPTTTGEYPPVAGQSELQSLHSANSYLVPLLDGTYLPGTIGPNGQVVPNSKNPDGSFIPVVRTADGTYIPGFRAPNGVISPAVKQEDGSYLPADEALFLPQPKGAVVPPPQAAQPYEGMYVPGVLTPEGTYLPNVKNPDGSFIPLVKLPNDGPYVPGFQAPGGPFVPAVRQPDGSWMPVDASTLVPPAQTAAPSDAGSRAPAASAPSSPYEGMYVPGILGPNSVFIPNAHYADGSFIPLVSDPSPSAAAKGGPAWKPGFKNPQTGVTVSAVRQPDGSWIPADPMSLLAPPPQVATSGAPPPTAANTPTIIQTREQPHSTTGHSSPTVGRAPSPSAPIETADGGIIIDDANGNPVKLDPGFGEYVVRNPNGSSIRYVEVEVHEEKVIEVPKVEVVEIERVEGVPEIVVRENVIEVPEVKYVTKEIEVVTEEERVREIPIKKVVKVPREQVREVEVPTPKIVERVEEVPRIVEVPKPYDVVEEVTVPVYNKAEVPTVVSQTLIPVMKTSSQTTNVTTRTFEPTLHAVDVYIPKAVKRCIVNMGKADEIHRYVRVPPAQFNSLVKRLNPHLDAAVLQDTFLKTNTGQVPMLPVGELVEIVPPAPGAQFV